MIASPRKMRTTEPVLSPLSEELASLPSSLALGRPSPFKLTNY